MALAKAESSDKTYKYDNQLCLAAAISFQSAIHFLNDSFEVLENLNSKVLFKVIPLSHSYVFFEGQFGK